MDWSTLTNGVPVDAADRAGFEAIITARHERQNQTPVAVIVAGRMVDNSVVERARLLIERGAAIAAR
jgi:citrate lyase beta subunit